MQSSYINMQNIFNICFCCIIWKTNFNIPLEFNEQLAEELHKPIVTSFKKRTVYSRFKDNIWGADLADMQLISKINKRFRFLLCVFDIFSKYVWVVILNNKIFCMLIYELCIKSKFS